MEMNLRKYGMRQFRKLPFWYLLVSFIIAWSMDIAAKEPLLILRSTGKDFDEVVKGMSEELADEFDISEMVVAKETQAGVLTAQMNLKKPKIAILLDNTSIALFKKYQSEQPDSIFAIPTVSLMGILIDRLIRDMKNATGIYYEIPIVTSAVNLRSILSLKMKKIGVIHRDFMTDFIAMNRKYCERENVTVKSYILSNKEKDYARPIKKCLKQLRKDTVDAIWVPNDNALLTPATIRDVWVPFVGDNKIPIIVGVEPLVNPALNFGTFAVLPDHVALGNQAADMVFDIMNNNWDVSGRPIEPPLSVYKIINLPQARNVFKVRDDNLRNIDRIAK
jgi:hypothetical protein